MAIALDRWMAHRIIATKSRATGNRWIGIATAIMCALAGGAIWSLLAVYARRDLIVFALPIALLVAWALRSNGYAARWSGALIAVGCVALSCAYSLCLQATAQVASLLGLPMRAALLQMDPTMAIDIAWADLDTFSVSIIALAFALAAAATMWRVRSRA